MEERTTRKGGVSACKRIQREMQGKGMLLLMMLFKYLVMRVIWGRNLGVEGKGELEVIQKKYIKWSFGLNSCTPDYIVYKDLEIDKISITAGYRAVKFEEKALKGDNRRLRDGDAAMRKKETDSGRQRRRKNAVYAEWKKDV